MFGTEGNVPSEDDLQLTYKDNDGDVIEPTENDIYLDASKNQVQNIIRASDGKEINVFLGETCIIGDTDTPEVLSIEIKTAPTIVDYFVGDVLDLTGLVITAKMADGDTKELSSGFSSAPENGATLTATDTSVEVSYGGKTASFAITVTAMSIDKDNVEIVLGATEDITVSGFKTSISATAANEKATLSVEDAIVHISAADGTIAEDEDTATIKDANEQTCTVSVKFIAAQEEPEEEPLA